MIVLDFVKICRKREEIEEENRNSLTYFFDRIPFEPCVSELERQEKKEVKRKNIDFVVSLFAYTKYV